MIDYKNRIRRAAQAADIAHQALTDRDHRLARTAAAVSAAHLELAREARAAQPMEEDWRGAPNVRSALTPTIPREILLGLLTETCGDSNGAQFADVLELADSRGLLTTWTVSELRALCGRYGIPVRESVKVNRRNRIGVHRADLAAVIAESGTSED
ncbi:hypothetical protein [Streptomyces sp. cg36]|uniref:hypothetical protein n=1 Tax=Streptomyces sp. cg36 TaxID=3238798 RepID=UPI0034E2D287